MEEYKKLQCIKKMEKQYKEAFYEIVKEYGGKLSARVVFPGSAFTLHDFDHHCFNIYRIISDVLFDEELVYREEYGLSQRELFILNLGVLFHDIGMSNVLGVERSNHSLMSARYIENEYKDSRSTFRKYSDLTPNELKALTAIIVAHSNIKDYTVDDDVNGLNSPKLHNYPAKIGIIRTKFLAGVLRLADELDVSAERIGTGDIEQEIEECKEKYENIKKEGSDEKIKEWEGYMSSLEHWKKLHLISHIQRGDGNDTIELHIDDTYVERCLDSSQTEKSISGKLSEVYVAIDEKLKEVLELVFAKHPFCNYVPVKRIEFITENKTLEKEISNRLGLRSLKKVEIKNWGKNVSDNIEESVTSLKCNFELPQILDLKLEKELYEEINKRNLIKFGHFLLSEKYCARDWIDTQEVVETKKLFNSIVNSIVKNINSKNQEGLIIIGVDLVGALVASRVAFALQYPLTYIVSEKDEKNNASQEIDLYIDKNKQVVLITDAIVTYETINKAIGKYSLGNNLDSIYTIFYRPSKVERNSLVEKTFSINNMFNIELFSKEYCVYNKHKCIAINRKISEGGCDNESN